MRHGELRKEFELVQKGLINLHQTVERDGVALKIADLRNSLAMLTAQVGLAVEKFPSSHADHHFGVVSYAQHGDDFMILNLLRLMGLWSEHRKPTYLDLGAHDPYIISNTALLYEQVGARGVNVEANPELIERFNSHRPEDKNVNVGVGTLPGTATFYMYSDTSGRNTFSPKEVALLKGVLTVRKEVTLPVKTLKQIVMEYCGNEYPDFLSCDIEGLDYDVLSTLPSWSDDPHPSKTPKLICVETRFEDTLPMIAMIEKKGYHGLCRMGENLFFVRKDFLGKVFG